MAQLQPERWLSTVGQVAQNSPQYSLIVGAIVDELSESIKKRKNITFFFSERIFKQKGVTYSNIGRFIKYSMRRSLYKNAYLLCASAYAARDYNLTGNFIDRCYKWGYFPETRFYSLNELFESTKKHDKPYLLWVGRFIKWKHPEAAIKVASYLKNKNIQFRLTMIGDGPLLERIQKEILDNNLSNEVKTTGGMTPELVRARMEEANIVFVTSDRNEGWGAVVNESMNSACAVVASEAVGSTPFLLDGSKCIYPENNWKKLCMIIEELVVNPELCRKIGQEEYDKIIAEWNANVAADRLIKLVECIESKEKTVFDAGPCSKA